MLAASPSHIVSNTIGACVSLNVSIISPAASAQKLTLAGCPTSDGHFVRLRYFPACASEFRRLSLWRAVLKVPDSSRRHWQTLVWS